MWGSARESVGEYLFNTQCDDRFGGLRVIRALQMTNTPSPKSRRIIRNGMLVVFFFAFGISISCNHSVSESKTAEIKLVWSKLPLYPGMIEVSSSSASGFDKAYIAKNFRSPADYEEVKQFYAEHLTKEGWQLSKERKLKAFWGGLSGEIEVEFRRGEYDLTIDYAPEDKHFGWNYGITISWR